jgi:hypothetical protein
MRGALGYVPAVDPCCDSGIVLHGANSVDGCSVCEISRGWGGGKAFCEGAAGPEAWVSDVSESDRDKLGSHGLQSGHFRHIACGGPEDGIQDHGEVYDVNHHGLNILLAGPV